MGKVFVAPAGRPERLADRLLQALPSLLWFLLAVAVIALFQPEFRELLRRTTRVKALGVEIEAAERAVGKAVAQAQKIPENGKHLRLVTDDPLRASLTRRWAEMGMSDRRLKILLLHDKPRVARLLRAPFAELGFTVDIGICSQEAASLLSRHAYDVVVSDINWKDCDAAGLSLAKSGTEFLQYAHERGIAQPTVFYIEKLEREKGTPAYAAGISNNWYEVLHFILDVVSRQDRPLS